MARTRNKRRNPYLSSSPPPRAGSKIEVVAIPSSPKQKETITSPLSNLRPLKKPANGSTIKTQLSENSREKYAHAVQLVKGALATDLTSGKNQDVESLMDVANKAFTSLDGLQADYEDLYKAVEDFIAGKMRVSAMENEIAEKKALVGILSQSDEICAKVEDVMKVQEKIEIELWNATRQIGPLRERIQEKKTPLEELEQELKTKEICINELEQKWAEVGASHAYPIAEKEKMAQEAEAARRVLADVYRRRDEAEAEIEMAKDELFSCLG